MIGNAAYGKAPLKNPHADAKTVAKALKRVGFAVTLENDLGRKGLRKAVNAFVRDLQGDDVGLFYYAGHGIEVGGENYLLGVDFDADNEDDAAEDAYKFETVMRRFGKGRNGLNIFVLDACRDDPYSRSWSRSGKSRGLTVVYPFIFKE